MARKVNKKHLINVADDKTGAVAYDLKSLELYKDQKGKPQPKEFIAKMISAAHCYDEFDNSFDSLFEVHQDNKKEDVTVQKTKRNPRDGRWIKGYNKTWKKRFNFAHEDHYDDLYTDEERIAKERAVFGLNHEKNILKVEETKATRKAYKLNGIFCLREDAMRGYFFDFLHIVAHNNLSLREIQEVLQLSSSQLNAIKEIAAALGMVFISHKTLVAQYSFMGHVTSKMKNILTIASWGMLNREAVISFTSCPIFPRCIDTLGVKSKWRSGAREATLNRIAEAIFKERRDRENQIEIEIGEILRSKYE